MERNFDFRKRLLEVHQKNRKNEAVFKTIEGVEICLGWQIVYPDDACRLLKYAARDLREYFEVSMDIYLKALPASKSDKNAKRIIITTVDRAPEFKCEYDDASSYRLVVKESQIVVCGTDARGTAQGVYFLEDMMSLNEGPVVSLQNICRRPLYSPRMTHSGFGLDLFPDAHLRVLAHYGYDAILVFTTDINMTPLGFVDFNDLIYRAAGYGIDVYSYSYYHNSMHPDDEGAREYYDDKYGRLFAECPGLKGIVFVGESMEFPSRDEHTNGVPRHMTPGKINRDGRPFPGWYPCNDYPQWISMVRDVIRDKNPEADIVFWTYNWGYVNREARLELIRNLPTDISLQATFEMFEQFHISDTVTVRCVDYTLFFEGPGLYFASEAEE
ncbi:MAG: hypothetical protein GX633_02045, partial [Clostridiales bacterium]|nr:hypothetical protein [Clostridiales bacterium]